MRRHLLLAVALLACVGTPPTDKSVTRTFIGTKTETRAVIGGNGGFVNVDVPAFYLVSRDNMVCEVDARTYATSAVGHLASCEWGEP